jgi:hypothetical protein
MGMNTHCNPLRTFPRCGLTIARVQTFGVRVRAKCLAENPAPAVAPVREALPADYDGEMYAVTVDGEENGGWFNSRAAARAHADYLRRCNYDNVTMGKVL